MKRMLMAAIVLGLAANVFAQGPGPGKGGPMMGPGQGMGPGAGPGGARNDRQFRFGSSNTRGWSMMSSAERTAHRNKMLSMTTLAECKAFQDQHRKLMEERAKQRGRPGPGMPRQEMCERMQAAGRIK
jgi:hypothetical protein